MLELLRYSCKYTFGDEYEAVDILRKISFALYFEARKLGLNHYIHEDQLMKWELQFPKGCTHSLYQVINPALRNAGDRADGSGEDLSFLHRKYYEMMIPEAWRGGYNETDFAF